jgi:uncharacterized oxidoreductase
MQLTDNTILITGGSDGIGLELAKSLAAANTVIICGRSETKLARAKTALPAVETLLCDVTVPSQRERLISQVCRAHPRFNLLINNAGGRQLADISAADRFESALTGDLALNFTAPVALCQGFLDHLRQQPTAAVVNVTTGLIYLPKAAYPFYCAAKAALHAYTQSLRWALRDTPVQVFEVLMPLVDTAFHEGRLPRTTKALSAAEAAGQALRGIGNSKVEIHVGKAGLLRWFAAFAPNKGLAIINNT